MHIQEFQEVMNRIYFHRDSQRGSTKTYKWLMDEVAELGEALKHDDRKALENEFADVFAWLASLANVVHVNLEDAALSKYDNMCPKCRKARCECPFVK